MSYISEKLCDGCRFLKAGDAARGKVGLRCMNPENGHRCGWIVSWAPEGHPRPMKIFRPAWCRKADAE